MITALELLIATVMFTLGAVAGLFTVGKLTAWGVTVIVLSMLLGYAIGRWLPVLVPRATGEKP